MRKPVLVSWLVVLALLLIGGMFATAQLLGHSVTCNETCIANGLAETFPMLEAKRVKAFRDQNWCRNLAYRGGLYSESSHPTTCDLFDGVPGPFTPAANEDFGQVREALRRSGARVLYFNVTFGPEGKVQRADYTLDRLLPGRVTFVFEAGRSALPPNVGRKLTYEEVNASWYVERGD